MNPADVGYRGLWRRRLLRDAHGEDRATQVWWLQGDGYYVDLRIPPERPDFSGVTGFDQCNDEQLAWLARQQGFAGKLLIDGNRLHWQRQIDLQPPAELPDIGRVSWQAGYMVEQGVVSSYEEHWQWQPARSAGSLAFQTIADSPARGMRLVVGDWFMQALDWRPPLPAGGDMTALLDRARGNLAALFNCAIDFGLCRGGSKPWQIMHSSLPWREGLGLAELSDSQPRWQRGDRELIPRRAWAVKK